MKPTTKSALLGAVLSAAVIVTASQFIPAPAQAQAPVNPNPQQYKLLGISQSRNANPEEEKKLNSLAADGWRVWTAAGDVVILAK